MENTTDPNSRRVLTWARVTVVALAGIAAVVSFSHAYDVVRAHGETGLTATLTPLTIDGMVFVSSLVLLEAAKRQAKAPLLAWFTLLFGIVTTVTVNVLHGWAHGPVAAGLSALPAISLVLSVELLMGLIRRVTIVSASSEELDDLEEILDPDPLVSAVRERFSREIEAGEIPSVNKIKTEMKVGHARASRTRDFLIASQNDLASLDLSR